MSVPAPRPSPRSTRLQRAVVDSGGALSGPAAMCCPPHGRCGAAPAAGLVRRSARGVLRGAPPGRLPPAPRRPAGSTAPGGYERGDGSPCFPACPTGPGPVVQALSGGWTGLGRSTVPRRRGPAAGGGWTVPCGTACDRRAAAGAGQGPKGRPSAEQRRSGAGEPGERRTVRTVRRLLEDRPERRPAARPHTK